MEKQRGVRVETSTKAETAIRGDRLSQVERERKCNHTSRRDVG